MCSKLKIKTLEMFADIDRSHQFMSNSRKSRTAVYFCRLDVVVFYCYSIILSVLKMVKHEIFHVCLTTLWILNVLGLRVHIQDVNRTQAAWNNALKQ